MTEEVKNVDLSLAENPEIISKMHELCIEIFGGKSGVRDQGALSSALHRGMMKLAYVPDTDALSAVCSVGYGIARNHAFSDGNKRTAALFTLAQLELNGFVPKDENEQLSKFFDEGSSDRKLTKFFEGIASGEISEEDMVLFVRQNFKPVDGQVEKKTFLDNMMSKITESVHLIMLFFGF